MNIDAPGLKTQELIRSGQVEELFARRSSVRLASSAISRTIWRAGWTLFTRLTPWPVQSGKASISPSWSLRAVAL
jgi:hypothetical protein